MTATLLKFPVISFRKIENPYEIDGLKDYFLVANIKDLPRDLDDWREINVRDAKLSSGVSKSILETLENSPESFFFKNRGITLIANKINFDNQKKNVGLELVDKKHEGILDGGHTFSVIQKYLEDQEQPSDAYVRIEVLEGFSDTDDIVAIVEARNKSTQVQVQSIEELSGKFEPIKNILKGQSYADKIAYKEYEVDQEGTRKIIDIKDILSYLLCFNIDEFGNDVHPTKAYTQKTGIVRQYAKDMSEDGKKSFERLIPLLPDILMLRDVINEEFKEVYNSIGRKFGSLEGIKEQAEHRKPISLDFTGNEVTYRLPSAYIYPILASFRAVIKNNEKRYEWRMSPIELFHQLKEGLVSRLADQAKHHKNPDKTAKDTTTWRICYDLVRMSVLEKEL